jgi:hypothetical protein
VALLLEIDPRCHASHHRGLTLRAFL